MRYETWEGCGTAGESLAKFAKHIPGQPTRLDVAFDFAVPEDYLSDHLAEIIEPHIRRKRLTPGVSGQGNRNTRYVGSIQSERRIKIYRRDFKDPTLREEFPPLLRVELELRKRQARSIWPWFRHSREKMLSGAAAHILDMTGLRVMHDSEDMPDLVATSDRTKGAKKLSQFIQQNWTMLSAIIDNGIDISPILDVIHESRCGKSARTANSRLEELRNDFATVTIQDAIDALNCHVRPKLNIH